MYVYISSTSNNSSRPGWEFWTDLDRDWPGPGLAGTGIGRDVDLTGIATEYLYARGMSVVMPCMEVNCQFATLYGVAALFMCGY